MEAFTGPELNVRRRMSIKPGPVFYHGPPDESPESKIQKAPACVTSPEYSAAVVGSCKPYLPDGEVTKLLILVTKLRCAIERPLFPGNFLSVYNSPICQIADYGL